MKIITLLLALLFSVSLLKAQELPVIYEKTIPSTSGKILKTLSISGDVKIKTWNKDEVEMKVRGNDKAKEKLEYNLSEENGSILAKVNRKSGEEWKSGTLKFSTEITIPEKYNLDVSTAGGDVKIEKLEGTMDVATAGGDVKLADVAGILNLKTSGGDIKVQNFKGNVNAQTSGGDIKLQGLDGEIKAETSGGDVKVEYAGENKGIDLSTMGGDVSLKLPADFSAEIDLKSNGGTVKCDLTVTSSDKNTPSTILGKIGTGGKLVKCRTMGGDIRISNK